ncbi:MAG TPA: ABC transporter ATP-binding protein, partial [Bacteroidales bacterium]|nr:ABC transporter ATP-binding protein [Bacteroidales bacterium]
MKVIDIKDVHKIYDETEVAVRAVDGVTLSFDEAEFAAIVGPSGSGKTTLLNLIGGLDIPTTGEITIAGTNLSTLKSSELIDFRLHNIGFVFQSYNLIPVLSTKENIEFIMALQKWPKSERDKRTYELLEAIGLSDRVNSRPSRMSGGQQQRVAVARALASRPK